MSGKKNLRSSIYMFLALVLLVGSLTGCAEVAEQSRTSSGGSVDSTHTAADLKGQRIGVVTGTIWDQLAIESIPDCQVEYFNSNTDLAFALEAGKVDGYMTDEPVARLFIKQYPSQEIFCRIKEDHYGYVFAKGDAKSDELRDQMDEFLNKLREDGTLQELDDIWFGEDEAAKVIDFSNLTGENGEIKFACATNSGAPFCYVKDGNYAGYDVDIAVRFCREYGYSIRVVDSDFNGILAGVTSGRCDFGASCISITEERKESMNFSQPNYDGGAVIVINGDYDTDYMNDDQKNDRSTAFGSSIKNSFRKTFIREARWRIFARGIGITLLITLISAVCGTLMGFLIFLIYRKNYRVPNTIVNVISDILQKTPVVVILMILYYVIFGSSKLEGLWVSAIAFSLIFACSVIHGMKVSVEAVDFGQMEAAQAIGFTQTQAFIRIILPQSLRYFLPIYKGDLVYLIKSTAIVGYIAVQDLTKVSDIIRSRTYEAFFPLISSAIVYFGIAWLLTWVVSRIQIETDPKRRSEKKILKGVYRK